MLARQAMGVGLSFNMGGWFGEAQGVFEGDVPPQKLENFVFLQLASRNLVNTFGHKFRADDE